MGKQWKQWETFLGLQNHCSCWLQPWTYKMLALWKKTYDKPRQFFKKQRHHFVNNSLSSQSYDVSSRHIQMWELGHEGGWAPKNWLFQTVLLEKTLESPLDSQDIKLVNPKGNQPCTLLVGMKNGAFVMKLSLKFPKKFKNRSNNPTSRFLY